MEKDAKFQKIRLGNLMEGLGSRWSASIPGRLLLARSLLSRDHVAAAVLVARSYEEIITHVGRRAGFEIDFGKKVRDQLEELAMQDEVLRRRVKREDLDLWDFRVQAVHGIADHRTPEITKEDARRFLKGTKSLSDTFEDIIA